MSKSNKKSRNSHKKTKEDPLEKLPSGHGWTLAATKVFTESESNDAKLKQIFLMYNITDEKLYINDPKTSSLVDFHLANGKWCAAQNFGIQQTQFICRNMGHMLENSIKMVKEGHYDLSDNKSIYELRNKLYDDFELCFMEFNRVETKFTQRETLRILKFLTSSFFRPIRVILKPFLIERPIKKIEFAAKIFTPIKPVPLDMCEEVSQLPELDIQFTPFVIPKGRMSLGLAKYHIEKYTEDMIDKINKRYDRMENMIHNICEVHLEESVANESKSGPTKPKK